ncbi:3-methylitaconate isomerase [Colletotrichum shisoi]|uniref:3-methylitaconate isomerase n=1 Tax=Colletotrichum shisoi TaxID=2078593 RepID=A0A5Q4BF47_9PEZI|nr:3-methylitaconate isomerase [Colletotrichum shisoi]
MTLQTYRGTLRRICGLRHLIGLSNLSRGFSSRSFPALFVRGGTSNGLVIHRRDLPPETEWHKVLPAAMGSPDPYGRQLNGIGSGISSTSKIVVLSPPSRPGVDVDYTFVQVGIKDGSLDTAGNCGNMSSAVGPMALDEGLVTDPRIDQVDGQKFAAVRIFNTNTSKVILSRFKVGGSPPKYAPDGDYTMDGVPGTNSPITLSFLDPAGAKTGRALPTGNACDWLLLPDASTIQASLVDVSNPGVFVRARDMGISSPEDLTPEAVEADAALKAKLDGIRRAGASLMGLNPDVESVPKIVLLFEDTRSPDVDIRCLALSMGQAHKAVPLTLALCLGAASQLPDTIPAQLLGNRSKKTIVIGHPSGRVDIGTTFEGGKIKSADLHRTARVLMRGDVHY